MLFKLHRRQQAFNASLALWFTAMRRIRSVHLVSKSRANCVAEQDGSGYGLLMSTRVLLLQIYPCLLPWMCWPHISAALGKVTNWKTTNGLSETYMHSTILLKKIYPSNNARKMQRKGLFRGCKFLKAYLSNRLNEQGMAKLCCNIFHFVSSTWSSNQ